MAMCHEDGSTDTNRDTPSSEGNTTGLIALPAPLPNGAKMSSNLEKKGLRTFHREFPSYKLLPN